MITILKKCGMKECENMGIGKDSQAEDKNRAVARLATGFKLGGKVSMRESLHDRG
jgi:hypothetical protein